MSHLVVYLRSSLCPDVARWRRWVADHPLEHVELDIDGDREAYAKVLAWTGHESVPTLVIAPDDGLDPIEKPGPLPDGCGPRAIDRGTMLSEPNSAQIGPFLERHGIPYEGSGAATSDPTTDAPRERRWWQLI